MSIYFTSDLHLGHQNILKYRSIPGVSTLAEHDEALITNWNETVGPDDIVFVLGDFAMGTRTETVPMAKLLQGHKLLMPGNHDYCWAGDPNWEKYLPLYQDAGFDVLPSMGRLRIRHDIDVRLCHFGYVPVGRHDGRYDEWLPEQDGRWLLHGHVHDAYQVRWENREINVGVDVWDFKPVYIDEIKEIIDKG